MHPILEIAAFVGIVNPIYLEDQLDKIREVSIAVELLHSGHLIHDDLIDDDKNRRGKPTFHEQLKNEINKVYKNQDTVNKNELIKMYGRNMSILGGTHSYLMGLDVIKSSMFPDKLKVLAINEYISAMDFMMKGGKNEKINYDTLYLWLFFIF